MSQGRLIRWGIIGGGAVVERKSGPGFNVPGKSKVVAVMRRDSNRAAVTANALGANRSYTSIEALLADSSVDAVYIATPPVPHFEHALLCCQAGKPVYIEKPFVTKVGDAEKLIRAFADAKLPLFVGHYRRALTRFRRAKEIIQNRLGTIVEFDFRLTRNLADDIGHPWMFSPEISGGGKFVDVGPHSIDMFIYLFGNMAEVLSVARHISSPNECEDAVCIAFRAVSGIMGTANYNFLSSRRADALSVYGTEGELHLSLHGDSPMREICNGIESTYDIPLPDCIEAPMISEVINYLLGIPAEPCFGRDAIQTVQIIESVLGTLR